MCAELGGDGGAQMPGGGGAAQALSHCPNVTWRYQRFVYE